MARFAASRPDSLQSSQPAPSSKQGDYVQTGPDLDEMASTLAAQGIESNELALDLILHDLAERARQATRASGSAIALQRDGLMVCRAAAGATAPDLGIAINTKSGLTAASVREKKTQWCSDTETDPRVDAEACRALGVRSIVVVPLFAKQTLVGVFEIFAASAEAFGEADLRVLQDLAQWVTEAIQSAAGKVAVREESGPVTVIPSKPTPILTLVAGSEPTASSEQIEPESATSDRQTKVLRATVVGLAIVLCLMLGVHWGWQKAHRSGTSGAAQPAANSPQNGAKPDANPADANPAPGQVEEIVLGKPKAEKTDKPAVPADRESLVVYQNGNLVFRQKPKPGQALPTGGVKDEILNPQPVPAAQKTPEPASSNAAPDANGNVQVAELSPSSNLTPVASLLALSPGPNVQTPVRISQGLTDGRLIHRVNPVYPTQALQRRIDGVVILQAVVGKDGVVHNPKAIRGNALLVTAALDAVKQWKYDPYKLNGEPVDMQTQITVNFKLP